jgi:lipoprotein-releasing system permease protein
VHSPSFHIALRFLLAHKRSLGLSALGVILGVGAFIAACAQTEGFEKFYIQTVLGSEGSLVITDRFQEEKSHIMDAKPDESLMVASQRRRKYYPGIADAYRIIDILSTYPEVVAASPIVEGRLLLRSGFSTEAVSLQGIDLDLHLRTTDFAKQVIRGTIDDFRNDASGACVGIDLAERMQLSVGQDIFIIGPDNDPRRFRIDVIYETGVWDFDIKNVFVHMRSAQSVLHKPYFTSFMLVKLADPRNGGGIRGPAITHRGFVAGTAGGKSASLRGTAVVGRHRRIDDHPAFRVRHLQRALAFGHAAHQGNRDPALDGL